MREDYALSRAQSAEAAGAFSLLWQVISNWQARRSLKKLDSLDDFLLRDIGVTREEVLWAEGLPLSVNAALALEERAASRQRRR